VATYQDLGLIKDNVLTIISPVKKVKQFELTPQPNSKPGFQLFYDEKPMTTLRKDLEDETISFYQTSAYLLKNKKYQK
jgi:hypothetical protein